jgi:hypothetical protein
MAFNPFRTFRKHQKAMFAVLAVLSMFIFVLTGSMQAGWDFFNGITYYFGMSSSKYPTVATVYGKRVDSVELQRLRYGRQIANLYMTVAEQQAYQKSAYVTRSLEQQLEKEYPDIAQRINMYTQQARGGWREFQQLGAAALSSKEFEKKPEGRNLGQQMLQMKIFSYLLGQKLMARGRTPYFGGSLDGEGLVNFIIWKHQADVRGIQYGKDEVQALVNKDTQNLLSDSDFKQVDGVLAQRYGRLKWSDLLNALADEFRVREAKEALGYVEPGGMQMPDPTPFEFWKFYQENRATARLALAEIPVRSPELLSKIGKPTEEELKALYDKDKDKDYSPQSPAGGFKQPPQIRVQWVRPQVDHFREQARRSNRVIDAATQVLAGGFAGAKPWDVLMPHAVDFRLAAEYELNKYRFRAPSLTSGDLSAYYPGTDRADNVAAAVGQAFGAAGTLGRGAALSGLIGYQAGGLARQTPEGQAIVDREKQQRAQAAATVMLSGFGGNALTPAATYCEASNRQRYLPMSLVRQQLSEKANNQQTLHLAQETMNGVRQQLDNVSKLKNASEAWDYMQANRPQVIASLTALAAAGASPGTPPMGAPLVISGHVASTAPADDKIRTFAQRLLAAMANPVSSASMIAMNEELLPSALAQGAIDRALANGDLVGGGSDRLDDAYNIARDPGLKPLRETYVLKEIMSDPSGRRFAEQFFNEKAEPRNASLYAPQELAGGEEQYLYWNTVEKPAYVPTFAEARPRVLSRWELDKARPLAETAAKELAARAEKGGQPEQNLRDAARHYGNFFELDGVARLVPMQFPAFQSSQFEETYQPYDVPEADRDKIEYPTQQMVDKLIDLKHKGQVAVVSDRPEAHYYVATLLSRTEPSVNSFYGDYATPSKHAQLLQQMEKQTHRVQDEKQAIIARLRAEAKVQINQENMQKVGPAPEED